LTHNAARATDGDDRPRAMSRENAMTSMQRAARRLGGAVVLALAALAAAPGAALAANYPAPVTDFGRFDSFPATVGPYARGEVTAFAPAMADFAIGYNSAGASLDNAVTLYFYPHGHDTAVDQLRDEQQQVLSAHPGARVVGQRQVTLGGREATLVSFAYDGDFAGRDQPLASQLLLVFRDHAIFMVRSTAPRSQGAHAEEAMLDLVRHLAWDSVPDR
jgi:hypothetical protein